MPIITYLLLAINIVLSLICFNNRQLQTDLLFLPYEMKRRGQWYRIITSGFIHGDQMHLLFNMMSLYYLGSFMEDNINAILPFGKLGFLIYYIGALLAAHLPGYFKHQNNAGYSSLGASGAVSAVILSLVVIHPWVTLSFFFIPMPGIVFAVVYLGASFYFMKSGKWSGIGHDVHLYGALYGIAFMLIFKANALQNFFQMLTNR